MDGWIDIDRWAECRTLERPGIVFEIANAAGQTLITRCVVPLPPMPHDWTSPPLRFRPIAEEPPRRSAPIPPPRR